MNELSKKWFFNDCKAYSKNTIYISEDSLTPGASDKTQASSSIAIVGSQKEKEQCIELGFVKKLVELLKLRRKILESKAETLVSGCLAKYNYKAGETIMNKYDDVLHLSI